MIDRSQESIETGLEYYADLERANDKIRAQVDSAIKILDELTDDYKNHPKPSGKYCDECCAEVWPCKIVRGHYTFIALRESTPILSESSGFRKLCERAKELIGDYAHEAGEPTVKCKQWLSDFETLNPSKNTTEENNAV